MNKINHLRMFFNALRTAILFFAGFLIYEIILEIEKIWNLKNPENKQLHFYQKKIYKFLLILIIDLILLYMLYFITGEHL
jgi:hypothetical protein